MKLPVKNWLGISKQFFLFLGATLVSGICTWIVTAVFGVVLLGGMLGGMGAGMANGNMMGAILSAGILVLVGILVSMLIDMFVFIIVYESIRSGSFTSWVHIKRGYIYTYIASALTLFVVAIPFSVIYGIAILVLNGLLGTIVLWMAWAVVIYIGWLVYEFWRRKFV